MDAYHGYTSRDYKGRVNAMGDTELRRQVKLSANALGQCAAIALHTNGNSNRVLCFRFLDFSSPLPTERCDLMTLTF